MACCVEGCENIVHLVCADETRRLLGVPVIRGPENCLWTSMWLYLCPAHTGRKKLPRPSGDSLACDVLLLPKHIRDRLSFHQLCAMEVPLSLSVGVLSSDNNNSTDDSLITVVFSDDTTETMAAEDYGPVDLTYGLKKVGSETSFEYTEITGGETGGAAAVGQHSGLVRPGRPQDAHDSDASDFRESSDDDDELQLRREGMAARRGESSGSLPAAWRLWCAAARAAPHRNAHVQSAQMSPDYLAFPTEGLLD